MSLDVAFQIRTSLVARTREFVSMSPKDLVPAILRIRKMHWEIGDSDFQNTIKKFKNEQYHRVSELMPLALSDIRFDKAAF